MADYATNIPQITSGQSQKEVIANRLFDSASPAMLWARRDEACTGLTWAFRGGRYDGSPIADGTVLATASNTNYVVAARSDGTVSISTSNTNWNDSANYFRLYTFTAGVSSINNDWEDFRDIASLIVGSAAVWGAISGTLSDQTDLQAELDLKQDRSPAIQSVASSATVTPTFANDIVLITAQAAGLTLANPTGSAIDGLGMVIRIKDNGTARTIAYDTQYRAIGVTLPVTTVISKTLYLAMIFNNTDTKWDVLAVAQEV